MKNYQLTSIILAAFVVAACGGGSDGTGQSSPAPVQTVMPSTPAAPEVVTTMDLTIAPEFDMNTSKQLDLVVDVSARYSGQVYLNLCEEKQNKPDYSRCILRSSLQEGALTTSVNLANNTSALVAELINLNQPSQSELIHWETNEWQSAQALTIN